MRKTVVDSCPDAVAGLLSLIERRATRHFVDFGCGRGAILQAVARRFPDLPCIGIDFDPEALARARAALDAAGVGANVRLISGDVLDHVDAAEDLAYCYIGGALNQRLGHALLRSGRARTIVSARYPIIGAVPSAALGQHPDTLHLYERADLGRRVEWDFPLTLVEMPIGTHYLLSRAIRVSSRGSLSAQWQSEGASGVKVTDSEFGCGPTEPGVPVICDLLLSCSATAQPGETSVVRLETALDGTPLAPAHILVMRATDASGPSERAIADPDQAQELVNLFEGAMS